MAFLHNYCKRYKRPQPSYLNEKVADGFTYKSHLEQLDGTVDKSRFTTLRGLVQGKTKQGAKYYAATQMRTRLCDVLDQTPESPLPGDRQRRQDSALREQTKEKCVREAALEDREISA